MDDRLTKWLIGEAVTSLYSLRPPLLGPALPPGFRRAAYDDDDENNDEDGEDFPGPALPPGYQAEPSSSEGEEEGEIGPMPAKGPVQDSVALDFERRARMMKEKLTKDVSSIFSFIFFLLLYSITSGIFW